MEELMKDVPSPSSSRHIKGRRSINVLVEHEEVTQPEKPDTTKLQEAVSEETNVCVELLRDVQICLQEDKNIPFPEDLVLNDYSRCYLRAQMTPLTATDWARFCLKESALRCGLPQTQCDRVVAAAAGLPTPEREGMAPPEGHVKDVRALTAELQAYRREYLEMCRLQRRFEKASQPEVRAPEAEMPADVQVAQLYADVQRDLEDLDSHMILQTVFMDQQSKKLQHKRTEIERQNAEHIRLLMEKEGFCQDPMNVVAQFSQLATEHS